MASPVLKHRRAAPVREVRPCRTGGHQVHYNDWLPGATDKLNAFNKFLAKDKTASFKGLFKLARE